MTKATEILDSLNARVKDKVTVSINGFDFLFHRDDFAYDEMANSIEAKNKLTPIKDYLLAIVDKSQKDDLLKIINIPTVAPQIAGKVNEVFTPKLAISVKN